MQKEDYTTNQAAQVLGVSASSVRKMIHGGELMAHKDEQGHHRIPSEALRAKLEEEGSVASQAEEDAASENGDQALAGLEEEVAAARREIRSVWEELHAMREEELRPLVRRLLSAEESRDALAEERMRLRAELERERRRAEGLKEELEDFSRKWWATRHEQRLNGEG
jgi:excisionase family DNA binding protein